MGKLVVVTGGTKGIGRAIAERFAIEGFDVCTCARNVNDLKSMSSYFQKTYPIKFHFFQADLSSKEETAGFVEFVQNLQQPVEVLVNNTGYFIPGEVCDEPDGTLESMIQTNLYSAYRTTRGFIEEMKRRKSGNIFNICSIASLDAYPNGGSYTISKFALLGFSKVLRQELLEFGIRVTAVMPGATRTASWEGSSLPKERFVKPEDIAESVFSAFRLSAGAVVEEIVIRPQLGDI